MFRYYSEGKHFGRHFFNSSGEARLLNTDGMPQFWRRLLTAWRTAEAKSYALRTPSFLRFPNGDTAVMGLKHLWPQTSELLMRDYHF
jgi:hypothetical protein